MGKCTFITELGNDIIGFASFDPRQGPDLGIIGHNCILPEYRGHGYGKKQTLEVLNRFRLLTIQNVAVTTCEHPFFLPAQRMYLSCGFQEKSRTANEIDPRYQRIEYVRSITAYQPLFVDE